MKSLSLILVLGLVTSCAASSGVEPTDLSEIQIGVSRAKVETALGRPILQAQTDYGFAAAFPYNKGTDPVLPKSYRGCVGGCAMGQLAILLFSPLAHDSIVSRQKRRLTVIFDETDKVQRIFRGNTVDLEAVKPGSSLGTADLIFGPKLHEIVSGSERMITYSYDADDGRTGRVIVISDEKGVVKKTQIEQPLTYAEREELRTALQKAKEGSAYHQWRYATLVSDPGEKLKWFCLAAHKGWGHAFYQLASLYAKGLPPKERNAVEGMKYYLLWQEREPDSDSDPNRVYVSLRKTMSLSEIQAAIDLAANWEPSPKSCPN